MADEQSGTDQTVLGGLVQDIQKQVNQAIGKLSGPGEQFIALGAVLIIFVDVFADIILDEWGVSYFELVPAWFVVAGVILHRFRNEGLPIADPLLLVTLGFIAGFVEVHDIITQLRNDIFDRDGQDIIYEIIAWVGGILMLVGAIQLWPSVKKS